MKKAGGNQLFDTQMCNHKIGSSDSVLDIKLSVRANRCHVVQDWAMAVSILVANFSAGAVWCSRTATARWTLQLDWELHLKAE